MLGGAWVKILIGEVIVSNIFAVNPKIIFVNRNRCVSYLQGINTYTAQIIYQVVHSTLRLQTNVYFRCCPQKHAA